MSLESLASLPGMTRYEKPPQDTPVTQKPYTGITTLNTLIQRKVVLLATAVITEENLFSNGLFQNVYLFYRMFEAMGWLPLLIVNKKPENLDKIPMYMKDLRLIGVEEIAKNPIPVKLYIEIGMSIDAGMRKFLKMCGARIAKLYLGNILNIDIETPIFYPSMHFSHHVIGELDDIWVSPHYAQHAQYARALNHIDVRKEAPCVVPYIWDPQVLLGGGERNFQWQQPIPSENGDNEVFLVLEPNISFQKCSLVPLMILEAWFRKNPTWNGEIVVINGERLLLIPFFRETIWNRLDIVKAGRVKMRGRLDILSLLKEFPSGIPVCHQWNNEYNYMVLEYFWTGYPVLHNASDWSDYGYYYANSDISGAVENIEKIRKHHSENATVYRAHARALAWKHSPYNPDVHREWSRILE
jgi:hypothetical protein